MWSRYQRQSWVHCSDTSLSTNQNLCRPQWRPSDISQTLFCFSCQFIWFEHNSEDVKLCKGLHVIWSFDVLHVLMCELRGERSVLMWRAGNHTKDSCCPCLRIVWNHESNQEISENKSYFYIYTHIWWNCVFMRVVTGCTFYSLQMWEGRE